MNRGEISARIEKRIDRSDSVTTTLIDEMINEVIRTVEETYPFTYTKKTQEATISANDRIFELPNTLILHQPYTLLVVDPAQSITTLDYLIKVGDESFAYNFPQPDASGDSPAYWRLAGGTNALSFEVSPVQTADRTLWLFGGHYYTGAFDTDDDTNWLTRSCPDLIIEGVSAKLFDHYGEPSKADRCYTHYVAYLNGDFQMGVKGIIEQEKMNRRNGRLTRVKTLDDIPATLVSNKKTWGY